MGAGAQVDPGSSGQGPTFPNSDDQAGQDSWAAAATPPSSNTATTPAAQEVQQAAAGAGKPPTETDVDMTGDNKPPSLPAPAPPLVTSQKPGGIAGVMQSILGALVGKTTPEYGTDQYGNKYVKETAATGGEQWRRLAGEAIVGAAEGLKAGRGAGNFGAAAAAGVESGQKLAQGRQQQEQQMTAEARAQNLEQAHALQQRMNLAEQSMRMTRLGQEIDDHTVQGANAQATEYKAGGGEVIGHVNNVKEGAAFLKDNPDHWQQLIKDQRVNYAQTFKADPKTGRMVADGFDVYLMPPQSRGDVMPIGTEIYDVDPADPTKHIVRHTSEPDTRGHISDQNTRILAITAKAQNDAAEAAQKAQDEKDKLANSATERKLKGAQTTEAYAVANKDNAEAKNASTKGDATATPELIDSIGTGKVTADRLGYLMSKNPTLLNAVVAKYPNFDSSKAAAYPAVYKDFTSTKAGTAGGVLNAGATAIEHLKRLQELNTPASHIYGTPSYNAYHNQLDTLAPELAKFYGDSTVPAIASLKSTLGATLPGGRDAAIRTQAQSMGKKFDNMEQQWKNAAPSPVYEAEMPNVTQSATEARAALDPAYHARLVAQQQPKTATNPAAASGMVTVQIPGQPAGRIPQANLDAFKKANPTATVIQ